MRANTRTNRWGRRLGAPVLAGLLVLLPGCESGSIPGDATCDDGVRNGDETDVDCGGSCTPCLDGADCSSDGDCQSGFCDDGTCTVSDQDLCPDDPDKTAPGVCGCGVADTDSDGDGTADCEDECPNDPDKTAPGLCGCGVPERPGCQGDLVIDHNDTDLDAIPAVAIEAAKQQLHIAYQHTSHGSQLITGMTALEAYPDYGGRYAWDDAGQAAGALDLDDFGIPGCADLSQGDSVDANGDTPWVVATRELLDNPANDHVNVVVWSWCSIDGHDAQRYVDNLEKLVAEYPDVTFVFMTGHAQGQGEDTTPDSVHYNNQLIRQHCADHGRWLFDFADIEAYDPDGVYYWDRELQDNLDYDGGNWAAEWCTANPDAELTKLTTGAGVDGYDGCHGCAHSDVPQQANLNCMLKGRAAWNLWARIAGWSG